MNIWFLSHEGSSAYLIRLLKKPELLRKFDRMLIAGNLMTTWHIMWHYINSAFLFLRVVSNPTILIWK